MLFLDRNLKRGFQKMMGLSTLASPVYLLLKIVSGNQNTSGEVLSP